MNQAFRIILLSTIVFFVMISCSKNSNREYPEDQIVDDTRFVKVHLGGDLDEPMEMAITKEGNVIVVERKGAVKYYSKERGDLSLIHTFRVFSGLEDGLLGVALDPEYEKNHFIYFFYSPAGDAPLQRVSRFVLNGTALDTLSEKVIIEIPTQRIECCHSAGSLAFGPDGNLFIAVGDNTNPHNPGYYNSIDERKGRAFWDAQRTAGNTKDLRGKILRIRVQADGSYTIPEGNLFDAGDSLARPEIYVMGCRNPYRISVDAKRRWLYWGDVGQNTIDDPKRGPISYDEWNVAREAGFFGWPYFAGPNAAYADFDFETNEIGPFFSADKPENTSVNNTGLRALPPAKGALIWYSYDESKEFEHLGTGGKSPIAGPVFYSDLYHRVASDSTIALPSYYDGKLFIAEWLRDWINVVTLTDDGKVERIEPFMRDTTFSHPIELEIGPEGALYLLEYGKNWFSKNEDAALYRIEYVRGNRPPVVKLSLDKKVGSAPLTVKFSSKGTFDPDSGSQLKYNWYFEGDQVQSTDPHVSYTFSRNGIYRVRLMVEDENGKSVTANAEVRAGNEEPVIAWHIEGNSSFYWDRKPVAYSVRVSDKEDGTLGNGIDASAVTVSASYSTMGTDLTLVEQSEELFNSSATGWQLMKESDCKACHALNDKSVGPSYVDVAARYPREKSNIEKLAKKIVSGGSGSWGENVMSAHPQLSQHQAEEMVSFILSLKNDPQATRPLPVKGAFHPEAHLKDRSAGDYILSATYTDKPAAEVGSNTVRKRIVLRSPELNAVAADADNGVSANEGEISFSQNGGWILFRGVDLTDVNSIDFVTSSHQTGGAFSLRSGAPQGEEVARVVIRKDSRKPDRNAAGEAELHWIKSRTSLKGTKGHHDLYIVFQAENTINAGGPGSLLLRSLRFIP